MLLFVLTFVCGAVAQERLVLNTPVSVTVSDYKVQTFCAYPIEGRIFIRLVSNAPSEPAIEKTYDPSTTPAGPALISGLNTADLSTKSLYRRILERLAQDVPGLSGAVNGTPQ